MPLLLAKEKASFPGAVSLLKPVPRSLGCVLIHSHTEGTGGLALTQEDLQ